MSDLRQSEEYAEYMRKLGWMVERHESTNCFIKKFPFFTFVKIPRPKTMNSIPSFPQLGKFTPTNIYVQPSDQNQEKSLIKNKFRKTKSPYYTKTLQIDLKTSKAEIFDKFKKDARYALRKSKDTKIYQVEKIDKFLLSWRETAKFLTYIPSYKDLYFLSASFRGKKLFLVTPDGASGAVFLRGGNTVYYWAAFTNRKGRDSLVQFKIVWSGICWAKDSGATTFDFEGIYDERFPKKDMLGFTHFKKSFGGLEVYYPGSYTKIIMPYIIK